MEESFEERKTSQKKDLSFAPHPQTRTSKEGQAFPTFAKLPDIKPLTKEVCHSTSYQTRARCKGQLKKTHANP